MISANERLGGTIRFEIPGIGIAGVPASPSMRGFIVPVRNQGGIDTGIAFLNPLGDAVTVEVSLLDAAGDPIEGAEDLLELPPLGHRALFITQLFEGLQSPFTGSLLAVAQDGRIAAVAVELGARPGEFTTLTVTPLEGN